jgi:hypothetical protein
MLTADRQPLSLTGDEPVLPLPPLPSRRLGLLLGGVLLPLFTLLLPLLFGARDTTISIFGLPLLFAAVVLSLAANAFAWQWPASPFAPGALTFAMVFSGYFSLALSPLTPFIAILSVMLIGLPLAAPFLAFGFGLRELIGLIRQPRFSRSATAGLVTGLLLLLSIELPALWAHQAAANNNYAAVTRPGVAAALERRCVSSHRTPLELWLGGYAESDQACALVYLATGRRAPVDRPRADARFSLRSTLGRLEGLRRTESEIAATVHRPTSTQNIDWQMEFYNSRAFAEEARLRIALPPHSAVHQVSLWVNGIERQAAFAGSEKVTEAYNNVAIRQQRDPLLITHAGQDQIFVQAFPVPAGGRMRIRFGIASPLGDRFVTPVILEQNLEGDRHHLTIHEGAQRLLDRVTPLPFSQAIPGTRGLLPALDPHDAKQMIVPSRISTSRRYSAIVIDGSNWMAAHARELDELLDTLGERPRVLLAGLTPRDINGSLRHTAFAVGGVDNVPALRQALRDAPTGGTVLWIHGPQPHLYEGPGDVEQALAGKQLLGYRLEAGFNEVWNRLSDRDATRLLPHTGDLLADVTSTTEWRYTRQAATPEATVAAAVPTLAALWAVTQPLPIAAQYRVITPDVGAVVLETDAQYRQNGLSPPPATGTGTPEPATWLMMASALAILLVTRKSASKPTARTADQT